MNTFSSAWTRRRALGFIAGTTGSIALHACTSFAAKRSSPAAPNLGSATFGVTAWIGNAALYIAKEKGFFQDAGLDLKIRQFGTVAESFPAFSIGQIQVVSPVTSEVVSLAAQGTDYRIVAVMDSSAGADAIVARNSIGSIADFKGKEIAVQKGGVGHFFLLQVLAEAGLSEKEVTIIDTTPETAVAAYTSGNVDIAYSYPPHVEKALAKGDGRIIYDTSKMPTAIVDFYAFNNQFIETNPQAVAAFISGIYQSLDLLNAESQEAYTIAAKYLEVEPQDVKAQLKGVRLPDLQTTQEMLSDPQSDLYVLKPMQAMAEFLKDQGQIKTTPDLSNILDPQFVTALNAST